MTPLFTQLTEQEKMLGNPHYLQEHKKYIQRETANIPAHELHLLSRTIFKSC
jgi:hypothetical protein